MLIEQLHIRDHASVIKVRTPFHHHPRFSVWYVQGVFDGL